MTRLEVVEAWLRGQSGAGGGVESREGLLLEGGALAAALAYRSPRNRYRPARVAWRGSWAGEELISRGVQAIELAGWEGLAQLYALDQDPEQGMLTVTNCLEAGASPSAVVIPLAPYYSNGDIGRSRIIGQWVGEAPDWSRGVRLLPPAAKVLTYGPNARVAVKLIETFVARGGDLYAPVGSLDGYPVPLIFALLENKLSVGVLEQLIARNLFNPSYRDSYGRNALHQAVPHDVAKRLLAHGANPEDIAELPRAELALLRLRGGEVPGWHGRAAKDFSGRET